MARSRTTTHHSSLAFAAVVALLLIGCTVASQSGAPGMTPAGNPTSFGTVPTGQSVQLYTLRNAHGVEVQLTNYGGIITSLKTPDRNGRLSDIVLGYDNLAAYVANSPYFGAIVGRYANRIARGHFTLDGATYTLAVNNGPNSLHGGLRGFDKVVWNARQFENQEGQGVALAGLRLLRPAGFCEQDAQVVVAGGQVGAVLGAGGEFVGELLHVGLILQRDRLPRLTRAGHEAPHPRNEPLWARLLHPAPPTRRLAGLRQAFETRYRNRGHGGLQLVHGHAIALRLDHEALAD